MSTIADIEAAISHLSRGDMWKLKERLDRKCAADWDAQIAEDARDGGPLDGLAKQAMKEFDSGHCRRLE